MTAMDSAEGTMDFNRAARGGGSVAIQIAPMIDIIFQLICFYLFVGQLIMEQKDASIELAPMAAAMAQAEGPAEITLNLPAEGPVTLNGRPVTAEEVRAALATQAAALPPDGRPLRVAIRADRRQSFERLDELLRTCRDAGLPQVVFRADSEVSP